MTNENKKRYHIDRSIYDLPKDAPIWSRQIYKLMNEKNLTQYDLAHKCDLSVGTISAWLCKSKNSYKYVVPRIDNFMKLATGLDTTVEKLMGIDECDNKSNETIHRQTGLSRGAINKLIECKKVLDTCDDDDNYFLINDCINVINFLIENIKIPNEHYKVNLSVTDQEERDSRNILNNMYALLFGEFDFGKGTADHAMFTETKKNRKGRKVKNSHYFQKSDMRNVYILSVIKNLNDLSNSAYQYAKEDFLL